MNSNYFSVVSQIQMHIATSVLLMMSFSLSHAQYRNDTLVNKINQHRKVEIRLHSDSYQISLWPEAFFRLPNHFKFPIESSLENHPEIYLKDGARFANLLLSYSHKSFSGKILPRGGFEGTDNGEKLEMQEYASVDEQDLYKIYAEDSIARELSLQCIEFNKINISTEDGWPIERPLQSFPNMFPVYVRDCQIKAFQIGAAIWFKLYLSLERVIIDSVIWSKVNFQPGEYFSLDSLPVFVKLENIQIDSATLDFTQPKRAGNKYCTLILNDVDISKLRFNYSFFSLYDNDSTLAKSPHAIQNLTDIRALQQKLGYVDGYEKADIELRRLYYSQQKGWGAIQNFVDDQWWGYGYKKYFIFRNSTFLIALFFFINMSVFKSLTYDVYPVDEFVRKYNDKILNKKNTWWRYTVYCFLYTCLVFWGLKLSFETIKLDKLGLVFLIVFEYLTGLLCLAYLAGYIITK